MTIKEEENLTKVTGKKTEKWMRSRDVRLMLGISDSTLQNMRISGAIPAYKLGSSWFYREDEIVSALEEGKVRKEVANG
jgi:hypothetical protein